MTTTGRERERDQSPKEDVNQRPVPGTPNPDFFQWLEKLFEPGVQFPEKIVVRQMTGKNGDRAGAMIRQINFTASEQSGGAKEGRAQRTSKEGLLQLSNELWAMCQERANNLRKPILCGFFALHFAADPDVYASKVLLFKPGRDLPGMDGNGHGDGAEDEDASQVRAEEQRLRHHESMMGFFGGALEGILDRYDRALERMEGALAARDARIEAQVEMIERLSSSAEDRRRRMAWTEVGTRVTERAANVVIDTAPSFLAGFLGKPSPTKDTPETILLKRFFTPPDKGGLLSKEQSEAIFGVWADTPPHDLIKPGVLAPAQGELLYKISQCEIPVESLDRLMENGDLAITMEQRMALLTQCGLTMDQLAPLQAMLQSWADRRKAVAK